jgi:xylose isomerase
VHNRYAGGDTDSGRSILAGRLSLVALAIDVEPTGRDPQPRSARQERLEHLVASYC